MLLPLLVAGQDLFRILPSVRRRVHVHNTHMKDGFGAVRPESMDSNIAAGVWRWLALITGAFLLWWQLTCMNQRFVSCCHWTDGSGAEVAPFCHKFIVAEADNATLLAGWGMLNTSALLAAVAMA